MLKQTMICLIIIIVLSIGVKPAFSNSVSDTWGSVKKYIALNVGTNKESWETIDNAIVTNGAMEMSPVGDGSYQIKLDLTPGAVYNYMFFAKTEANPPAGLQAYKTYWDCVPNGGFINCGTDPSIPKTNWDTVTPNPCYFAGVGERSDNARRVISVPTWLNEGETFYVFNNFSDKPGVVSQLTATAVNTTAVRLNWGVPYGYWGSGQEEKKAADVIAGGSYKILRYINNDTSQYTVLATVAGNEYTYLDSGLNPDWWYWYVIVCYDAYDTTSVFSQGISDWSESDSAIMNPPVKVILKVDGFDYDYVEKNSNVVYLTPADEKNKMGILRYPGKVVRIRL
ncbi:fibronectin type III domain-containing protein [Candidatus Dependentiae bacterium]|nr:fibronectin type III domain-containing protein [Candidatus Dependentiae bacterium]